MSDTFKPQDDFDDFYYAHGCGLPYERNEQWLGFFQQIADRLIADFQPKSVLDAGCAKGFLVEGFRNRGVEAWGVDISEHAIQSVHESIKSFCWVGSIADPFTRRYDLIVTVEVMEHMPADLGRQAIANLCAHSDRILFTSTPFDYKETTHYNVQPPEYWAREFARHGFFRDVDYDASFITAWATCFHKVEQPAHQLAYDYERRFWLLWKENTDLRSLSNELRNQVRGNEQLMERFNSREAVIKTLLEVSSEEIEDRIRELIKRDDDSKLTTQRLLDEKFTLHEKNNELIEQNAISMETIQELSFELAKSREKLEMVENEAESYKQRWKALEVTPTWKILSWLYKIRNGSKQKD